MKPLTKDIIVDKLLRNFLFRKFLSKRYRPKKYIFLVGCYNSGTTIISKVLSSNPLISTTIKEGVVYTDILKRPEDLGWNRMWSKCIDYVSMPNTFQARIRNKLLSDWSFFFSSPVFLEKSISNTARINWLNKNIPNAYFLCIVRHPYPVTEGIIRKARPTKQALTESNSQYTFEQAAFQWLTTMNMVEDSFCNLDTKKKMTIKYEEFVENPSNVVENIYKHFDIDYMDSEIKYSNNTLSVHGNDFIITNKNDAFSKNITNNDKDVIKKKCKRFMNKYDY